MANVYTRALKRAAQIVGGHEALASRLKVKPASLALWLNGLATPPAEVFLEAVDVISAHEFSSLRPVKD